MTLVEKAEQKAFKTLSPAEQKQFLHIEKVYALKLLPWKILRKLRLIKEKTLINKVFSYQEQRLHFISNHPEYLEAYNECLIMKAVRN